MTAARSISSPILSDKPLVSGFSAQRSIFSTSSSVFPKRRNSAFCEVGLGGEDAMVDARMQRDAIPDLRVLEDHLEGVSKPEQPPVTSPDLEYSPPTSNTLLIPQALLIIVCAVFLLWPSLPYISSDSKVAPIFAKASQVESIATMAKARGNTLLPRQSLTEVCRRWAQMSAIVNGTLYVYGGQATTSSGQTQNTWNNNFLTLDLTKTWQIGSPTLTSAARPTGLPPVSLGTMWNDMNNLYIYGGEFSWQPAVLPVPNAIWQYSIASKSWTQQSTPTDTNGQPVQRAAEGAGVSVPHLGRGFYLGGHLDGYTTVGWSQSVPRLYLQSTLEYTMPGFANTALTQSPAGSSGAYRNITASSAGFPQRADGVLVYVPGYGQSGIIVALAGGTVDTFTQMNIIDVYDIAGSTWYRQATSGPTPKIRVNPCAVAVSAADGSSTQIYMYGGQNLQPALNQTQYDDMWILTVPSFTWIQVDQSNQSTPPARAGHTCNVWNGQMVVVGGYVPAEYSCDSPGIYVFNTTSLSWQNQYTSLQSDDPLNRQTSQRNDVSALQGSYGYLVPAAVQQQIGGNSLGGATATAPAQFATSGPLVSGKPKTYTATATASGGAGATSTSQSGQDGGNSGGSNSSGGSGDSHAGVVAAGVIAGVFALLAAYLGFCAWLWRRQLSMYKNHLAMMQRESLDPARNTLGVGVFPVPSRAYSDKDRDSDIRPVSMDNRSGVSLGVNTSNSGSAEARSYVDSGRRHELSSNNPYLNVPGGAGYATAQSSTDDLLRGQEPTFLGVMLNPRRSLRVVNKD